MIDATLTTFLPVAQRRRGRRPVYQTDRGAHDIALVEGLARAFFWHRLLESGRMQSGSDIARAEGLHQSVVNELLRLTLLAPDLVERFIAGQFPRRLTLMWFQRHPLPSHWQVQRALIDRFEETP